MAIPVLLILVALWGIFFLWPLVSGRFRETGGRALASVDRFRHGIPTVGRSRDHRSPTVDPAHTVIGPAVPGLTAGAGSRSVRPHPAVAARRRRRTLLVLLGSAAALTLLVGLATDATAAWLTALVVCSAFVAYLGAVARLEQAQRDRREKVRYLPAVEPPTRRVEPPAAARHGIAQPG